MQKFLCQVSTLQRYESYSYNSQILTVVEENHAYQMHSIFNSYGSLSVNIFIFILVCS